MISKSLSTSERFAALYETAGKLAEFCQSLYPLLVAHADDWGCLPGDVFTVKHLIHPTSPRKSAEFGDALEALHRVGLVTWYQAEGKRYVAVRGWFSHQQLKGHDQDGRKRTIPPPPENASDLESFAQIRPTAPKSALTEEKRTELKGTEGNRTACAEEGFSEFWDAYPKKKAKPDAEKAWKAINPRPRLSDVLVAVEAQAKHDDWRKESGKYIPYPATWLRARRWEDEVGAVARDRRLGPDYEAGYDWFEECKTVHGGACELDRHRHMSRMQMERAS